MVKAFNFKSINQFWIFIGFIYVFCNITLVYTVHAYIHTLKGGYTFVDITPKHIIACNLFIGWRRLNAPLGEVIKYFIWIAVPYCDVHRTYKVYAVFIAICVAMQLKPYKFVKDLDWDLVNLSQIHKKGISNYLFFIFYEPLI